MGFCCWAGCDRVIPDTLQYCAEHWELLPKFLRFDYMMERNRDHRLGLGYQNAQANIADWIDKHKQRKY